MHQVKTFYLQQADGDGEGHAGGAQWAFALGHGPRVPLELPQQVRQVHVHLVHRLQEPGQGGEARGSDKEGLVQCVQGNAMELEKERLSECV